MTQTMFVMHFDIHTQLIIKYITMTIYTKPFLDSVEQATPNVQQKSLWTFNVIRMLSGLC